MDVFATDLAKLGFLLEADVELLLAGLDGDAARKFLAGYRVRISTMASAMSLRVAS